MRLLIFLLLPLAFIGLALFAPLWDARKSLDERERSVAIRMTIFAWLVAVLLVAGLVLMPNKGRVLMLVPLFAVAVMLGRLWKQARLRARRDRQSAEVDLERMKRVN